MAGKMEDVEVKNISAENGKKIIELIDEANLSVERVEELIKQEKGGNKPMADEKMTEEQYIQKQKQDIEKIEEYIQKNPGVSYRDAMLFCVDRKELTEAEKKVEKYLEDHKGENLTYRQAVLACLESSEEPEKKEE